MLLYYPGEKSDTIILGNNLKKWAKESAAFLPLDYQRHPESPLKKFPFTRNELKPRSTWKLQKLPDSGAAGDNNVGRWSQRLQLVLAFCSRPCKYCRCRGHCSSLTFVTNAFVVTPGCLLIQCCPCPGPPHHPTPPPGALSNIRLIFLEAYSRRMLHQSSMSDDSL